jgi:hypothetical protein
MKPQKDYSWIKGFNHGFIGIEYDHDTQAKQMGYAKRITLNSSRLFMPMFGWQKNRDKYLKNLIDYVHTAWDHGISTTPILLMPYFTKGQKPYWTAPEHSNAFMPGCYEPENYHIGEEYVKEIVQALKNEPGLLFWDVMNEPSYHGCVLSVDDPAEKERRYQKIWDFVKHFVQVVRDNDKVNALGIGHTYIEDTEKSKTGDCVDIIIFHDYLETRSRVEAVYRRAVQLSKKYGKPIINNETGCLCRANPYDEELQMCAKYNIGYYLFELMITKGMWEKVHGIFYDDGTVRDPSIVAAVMGCFRNRGPTAVYTDVNQEGHAEKAVALAKEALDTRAPVADLLEAAEYCVNLLEAGEHVPMAMLPSAKVLAYRAQKKPDYAEVRAFTWDMAQKLMAACQMLPGDRIGRPATQGA